MGIDVKNVSDVVGEIKGLLETEFSNISMQGEITNLSLSSAGHWYFTLSDKEASMSAALFKMDALRNPHIKKIKDGEKVIVAGDVSVYPKRGTFQIIVKKIVPMGVGDLKEQFEKLKRRLAAEGLFDLDKKKTIPSLPKRVAIITAQRGAALQDFINIYKRRSLWMDLLVVPAVVQGDDAPRSLRSALHNIIKYNMQAEEHKKIDVVVLARGGGSLEDLWAFNDEGLAWDLFNCPIPTISAVGHEVDFSISDFVCDLRAETPSAAAEILTHQQTQIKDRMISIKRRILYLMDLKIGRLHNRLKTNHPANILNILLGLFHSYQKRLHRAQIHRRLNELTHINDYYLELDDLLSRLQLEFNEQLTAIHHRLDKAQGLLGALNPGNVLERGYVYTTTEEGRVIGKAKQLDQMEKGAALNLHFHDGKRKVQKV